MSKNIKKDIFWRVIISFSAVVVFAIWVGIKVFVIQLKEGDKWTSMADSLYLRDVEISPIRGNIYSDNGSLLATSMPIYEVRWDPTVSKQDTFNKHIGSLAQKIASTFGGKTQAEVRKNLVNARKKRRRYVLIKRKVSYTQLKTMKTWPIFRDGRYGGGLRAELTTVRAQPAGKLASRTIGYRKENWKGVGLERSFDGILGGTSGKKLVQKISGGERPINDENLIEPVNGKDIYSTINLDVQDLVNAALHRGVTKHNAHHGSAILMEMSTGKIKAISNLELKKEDKTIESYNYAIGEQLEPGSTIKVFSLMALLEDKVARLDDSIKTNKGRYIYGQDTMLDSELDRYNKLTLEDVIAISSNVGISSLVYSHYRKRPAEFIKHLKKLDLDKRTGIEIMGEKKPYINRPGEEKWSSNTSLPWMSIGYEALYSPIQILTAYNAVINNGRMVKPYLVSKIAETGRVVQDYGNEGSKHRVCSEKTSKAVRQVMRRSVTHGTAKRINSSSVSMAGKTGTAKIASKEGYTKEYNASFVGHFPADKPIYTCIVVIHKPQGSYYGSSVAAPIFAEIAKGVYSLKVREEPILVEEAYKSLKPATGHFNDFEQLAQTFSIDIKDDSSSSWVSVQNGKAIPKPLPERTMPQLLGMSSKDAVYIMELKGYDVHLQGYGRVINQVPAANSLLGNRKTIYLELGI